MRFIMITDAEFTKMVEIHLTSHAASSARAMKNFIDGQLNSPDADNFKFTFSMLYQAGLFVPLRGGAVFNALMRSDISELSNTLHLMLDNGFLIPEGLKNIQCIFNFLLAHSDLDGLSLAIQNLVANQHKLLSGEYSITILNAFIRHNSPHGFSSALIFLKDYELLNRDNIRLIAQYPRAMLLAKELRELFKLPIDPCFFQDIFLAATAHQGLLDFCRDIKFLHENNNINKHSIRNTDGMSKLINDLSSFREKSPLPFSFFSTSPLTESPVSCTASIDSSVGSLSDLLALCHKS